MLPLFVNSLTQTQNTKYIEQKEIKQAQEINNIKNFDIFTPTYDKQEDIGIYSIKSLSDKELKLEQNSPTLNVQENIKIEPSSNRIIEFYTGHADLDNTIIDALNGQSDEVKTQVYDTIRKSFFPKYTSDLSESDRQAAISLGLKQAEYLANQNFDDETKTKFMEVMNIFAGIATQGTKAQDGSMQYDISSVVLIDGNGHIQESNKKEVLYTMEKESPEDYNTYLNLLKKSTDEADKFAIDWILKSQNLNNMIKNHAEYEKHQKEYYDNFKNVQIDKTFENVDTSNRENFIESIKKQDYDDFRQFRGLKTDKTEINPSRRSAGSISKKTHQKKQHDIGSVHDPLEIQYPGVIHQGEDHHDDHSHDHTRQLSVFQILSRRGNKHYADGAYGEEKKHQSEIIKT